MLSVQGTKLVLTSVWPNYKYQDFSEISKEITEVIFDNCEGLRWGSLATLPERLISLTFKCVSVYKFGFAEYAQIAFYKRGWNIPHPDIKHLGSLKIINFFGCELDEIDWLPHQVESVHLEDCALIVSSVDKTNVFSLSKLGFIKNVTLKNCKKSFIAEFSNENNRMESLQIFNHREPRVSDSNFLNFPSSLKKFEINGADITDKTIEKLESDIQFIKIDDCKNVTMNVERANLLFSNCAYEGLKKETFKTEEFRKLLERSIIGQNKAIEVAFTALCTAISDVVPGDRPAGVFLFAGPSGVGKTEMAKTVALVGKRELLRYDMGEFQQEHEVSKLLGSPPGFVGYDNGSKLADDVRKFPNAVVLFDEIEKAHSTIHKALYGVFDAGRLTDNKGNTTSFAKSIIIMTSNVGADEIEKLDWNYPELALKEAKKIVIELLKQKTAAAFVGRIDNVVPFRPLAEEAVQNIIKSKIESYQEKIKQKHKIHVQISENVWSSKLSHLDPALGVRPIWKEVENELNAKIGSAALNKLIKEGDRVQLSKESGGEIKIKLIRK